MQKYKNESKTANFDQNKTKVWKNAEHLHVYIMKYFEEVERATRYPRQNFLQTWAKTTSQALPASNLLVSKQSLFGTAI